MSAESEEISFEKAVDQLEETINNLESRDLSLQEALDEFESGVKLAKFCAQKLDQAEEKIEIIKQEADEIEIEPYSLDEGSEE